MNNSGDLKEKWKAKLSRKQAQPVAHGSDAAEAPVRFTLGGILYMIWTVFYRLRSVFLAIPVVFAALRLAAYNSDHLPLLVGINIQTTGEFAHMISRQSAVMYPLFLTCGCLGLMFLSRKPVYPWLISIFSLTIPVLLLVTNMLG